jgi:hypothetical protein
MFIQPAYNLEVGVFRPPNLPPGVPDFSLLGNLSPGRIVSMRSDVIIGGVWSPGLNVLMWLRLPPLSDVRGWTVTNPADIVEVPLGSSRFYWVWEVDDIAKGFPNEHRFAWISKLNLGPLWPVPMP